MQTRLATILERNVDWVLQQWLNTRPPTKTGDGATLLTTETTHDIRRLLEGMIRNLQEQTSGLPSELQEYAQGLGHHYHAQGGDLQGIVGEFAALRSVLWHLLSRTLRQGDEPVTAVATRLDEALDSFMLSAMGAYAEAYRGAVTQAAALDSLTGTFTRGYVMEQLRLEMERARRYRHPFTLLLVDIDRFKRVNDTFGHLAGDEALRRFSAVLREVTRSADVVGRYGGEEFLMLLTETPAPGGTALANRVLRRLGEVRIIASAEGEPLTASIGVAAYPDAGTTADALIGAADAALYEAKSRGGNAFAIRRAEGGFEMTRGTAVSPVLQTAPLVPSEPAPPVRTMAPEPVTPEVVSPPFVPPTPPSPVIGRFSEPPTPELVPPPPTAQPKEAGASLRAAFQAEAAVTRRLEDQAAAETNIVEERVHRLEQSMEQLGATLERLQERLIIIGGLQRSAEERAAKQGEMGATDNGRLVQMLEDEKERLGGRVDQLRGEFGALVAEMEELRQAVRRRQSPA